MAEVIVKDSGWKKDPVKLLIESTKKSLEEAAIVVEADAKLHCPWKTGTLRDSIEHETKKDEAAVFSDLEYSDDVEYGTVNSKAQPFLRPALDNNKNVIKKIFNKNLGK